MPEFHANNEDIMTTGTVTLLDSIIDFLATYDDTTYEGTATELLELIAAGTPNESKCDELPADATILSKALSVEPRLNKLGVTVGRLTKSKESALRIALIPGFYDVD